jgi:hypothetical protein
LRSVFEGEDIQHFLNIEVVIDDQIPDDGQWPSRSRIPLFILLPKPSCYSLTRHWSTKYLTPVTGWCSDDAKAAREIAVEASGLGTYLGPVDAISCLFAE